MHRITARRVRTVAAVVVAAGLAATATGCTAGASTNGKVTLNVAMVDNPQMEDMEKLTHVFTEEHPNIKVHYITMQENDLRDAVTKDVATQGGLYDIVTVGANDVPLWQKNGWITNLSPYLSKDKAYDINDLFPPVRKSVSVDGQLYAAPFYGESSFLMYNEDMFKAAGLTMPEHPTWTQVADLASKLKTPQHAGICLRGEPGWGEGIASLNTVVNTFGGAWYDKDWNAQVDKTGFKDALTFWANTIHQSGEADPVSDGFTQCLNIFTHGKAAIWYDATSAAGTVEDPSASSVAGHVGYVYAPVEKTKNSGWLWSWNLALESSSKKKDAAEQFISWATSKPYIKLVGEKLGWTRVPPGSRVSTYSIPQYQKAAAKFADLTKETMLAVNPEQPGLNPQPYVGIQYMAIPEWESLGNQASQIFANVYAGRTSVDSALSQVQALAQKVGDAHKKKK